MAFYLPTVTTLAQGLDGSLSIRTVYVADLLPNVIQARIADKNGYQDGVYYQQGDLLFQLQNYPKDIDFTLDPNTGNLLVSGPDADRYSIVEARLVYLDPATMATKDLGQVAIFHKGPTPPANKELLWKDTATTPSTLKEWDEANQVWSPTRGSVVINKVEGGSAIVAPVVSVVAVNPVRQFANNASAGNTTLNWTVTRPAGGPTITAIAVAGISIDVTGETQSGSTVVTTPLNKNTTHTVTATAGPANSASATASVQWQHKRLFIAVPITQDLKSLSAGELSQFLNGLPQQNWELGIGFSQSNRIFTGTPSAPVRAYEVFIDTPQQPLFRVNGAQNNAWESRSFTYTNSDGYATSFRLYSYKKEVTGKLSVDTY